MARHDRNDDLRQNVGVQIMSVTGPVQPCDLGVVLPHEHVFADLVREYRGTGLLNDEYLACRELEAFAAAGGTTLVDLPLPDYHLALAKQGSYVSFDAIGNGTPYDLRRTVDYVVALVRAGFGSQILLSHDIFMRGQLHADGGPGYTYLLTDFLPLLIAAGLDEEEVRRYVTVNPRAALTGEPST
jgi:predicted metal-dependent phosphotriesterase family hydrolase